MKQLSLFRTEEDQDKEKFKRAETLKIETQRLYQENYDEKFKERESIQPCFYYFTTNAESVLAGEEIPSSDAARVLIRRFKSTLKFISQDGTIEDNIAIKSQISDYWAARFYSDDHIDSYWFVELSKRICSIEFALEFFKDEKNIQKFEECEGSHKILLFDHLLRSDDERESDSIFPKMERIRVNDGMKKLTRLARKYNWILLGYDPYFRNNSILIELQEHQENSDYLMFGNDYVFLNNVEFAWENGFHTSDWPNIILPPSLAFVDMKPPEQAYFYCKGGIDGIFHRMEAKGLSMNRKNFLALTMVMQGRLDLKGMREY